MFTTSEACKRRSVNHTRARSLASPSRAEAEAEAEGVGVGVGVGVAWCGVARRSTARPAGRAVHVRGAAGRIETIKYWH